MCVLLVHLTPSSTTAVVLLLCARRRCAKPGESPSYNANVVRGNEVFVDNILVGTV